jgi:hypothetical protein
MRLTVVPQTGQGPLAIRIPVLEISTLPWKSRFSLHLTQYPLYFSAVSATVPSSALFPFPVQYPVGSGSRPAEVCLGRGLDKVRSARTRQAFRTNGVLLASDRRNFSGVQR